MKRAALLSLLAVPTLVVAACAPASPEPARPTATASASAPPPVASSAEPVAPPPDPTIPAQDGTGERAYVIDGGALVEVVVGGGKSITVVDGVDTGSCNVDHRANVVWYGKGGALYAFDLADRKVHLVVNAATTPRPTDWVIDWGNEKLGGDNKETFDAGAELHVTASPPTIGGVLGCTGLMGYKCYVAEPLPPAPTGPSNAQTPRPKLTSALLPEIEGAQKGVATMTIADAAYLGTLAERGAKASLWSNPPVPQAKPRGKKPSVDGYFCYANKPTCGDLIAIPGTDLWWVGTSDLREMEWHREMRDLWDAKAEEFVNIKDGKLLRSHKPAGMELGRLMQVDGIRISTAGVLMVDGNVFDGTTLHYAPKDGKAPEKNASCGFASGGFRMTTRPLVPNPPNTF